MTTDDSNRKVREIVADQLGRQVEQIHDDHRFKEDLGADSLDSVETVMAIEEEFGIEIPDEEAEKITTVKEAIDYINKRIESKGVKS